jgi:hypothetical protein
MDPPRALNPEVTAWSRAMTELSAISGGIFYETA